MATANADFDPFYLRHVSFYLIKYYISHLLTDTSKNERNLLKACSNVDDFTALDTPASTPRVPRIRVFPWPSALRQQLELPQ